MAHPLWPQPPWSLLEELKGGSAGSLCEIMGLDIHLAYVLLLIILLFIKMSLNVYQTPMYLMNYVKMNSVSAQPTATTMQDPVRRPPFLLLQHLMCFHGGRFTAFSASARHGRSSVDTAV